ncbi:LAFE_0H00276g1_1 [Lachancea fermentati]|uniref:LAFE_0H00276g1_1 n=1 Tax=Lachancea fermentati TaxID=4955 RepID=A0A1G4MJ82_LACFM|nr:LAFE_0H00276g1_1 [Lachancea fermentati]
MSGSGIIAQAPVLAKEPIDIEVTSSISQEHREHEQSSKKLGIFQPWYEPGTSSREKWLIFKLDVFILSYSCLAWFLKYLDQQNVTNAYANGMMEDMKMNSNQLSWLNTYFAIGSIVGSVPASILITHVRPNIYLPVVDFLWSLFVLLLYKCTKIEQMYALRFLCGFAESSANPCIHFLLGSFYKSSELGRRSAFFIISGVISQAISSFIMNGLDHSLDGKQGLPAWKWLFIIDFVIGMPIVVWGYFAIPQLPARGAKAFYLNEWERQRISERIEEDGRTQIDKKWNKKTICDVLGAWQPWAFTLAYSFWQLTAASYSMQFFTLYLKAKKIYTQTQINYIPDAISCVNLVTMISSGIVVDLIRRRWPVCLFVGLLLTVAFAILRSPNESVKLRFFGYILTGVYGCYTPILSGWANIACGNDPKLRAFSLSIMIAIGTAVGTPFQQYVFPSSEAPFYNSTNGFSYALGFTVLLTIWTGVGLPLIEARFTKKLTESTSSEIDSEAKGDQISM